MESILLNYSSQTNVDFLLFESRSGVAAAILPDAPRFTVVAVTHDFLKSVGMNKEDIVGKGHFELFPESPESKELSGENNIRAAFESVIQHKKPYELPVQRYDTPNGDGTFTERYWQPQGSPVLNESGELLYIIHAPVEVTEHVKAKRTEEAHHALEKAYHQIEESQKALSSAHERIIDILESTNDAFYAVDTAFHFTYVNKRTAQLWGKESESLIGQHYWTVVPKAVNSLSYHKHYEALEKGQPVHYETVSPLLGIWIDTSIYPSKDGGLSVFFRDITERKKAELALKESEEELERKVAERTAALAHVNEELKKSNKNLEEFAYAASHDMKEPIRKIHFFADRLKTRLLPKMEEEDLRYFERLEMGAKRMNALIDDLLLYSHVNRGMATIETVDLNQMLAFVLDDLELQIEEKGAKVEINPLPTVQGRPRQLQQLFENLIANALKYSKEGVAPEVRVSSRIVSDMSVQWPSVNPNKQYHLIEVKDLFNIR